MRRVRFVLSRALLALGLLYLLICGVIFVMQERLIFQPDPVPRSTPYSFRLAHEEVFLPVEGDAIHGVVFHAAEPQGAVLYLHGSGGNLSDWGRVGPGLVRRGYEVLLIDYRGFGKSGGRLWSEATLLADAEAGYAFLRERFSDEQIIVYGRSLGSGLALALAARHPVRAVVLETPYYSVAELAQRRFPFMPIQLLKYPLRSSSWIGDVRSPISIIHGTADQLTPYSGSLRLIERAAAPVQLYTIVGAHHGDLSRFPTYSDAQRAIFGPVRE